MSTWDHSTDVLVIGFGAAGACTALQAREEGLDVLVIDRFEGGGSTRISGGNIYAGGGTPQQIEAGIEDSTEDMFRYLDLEVGDAVSPQTLLSFCENNRNDMQWLQSHGVQFRGSACPYKTSYPVAAYGLYVSGNEIFSPFKEAAKPAARGHLAQGGSGMAGNAFFTPLKNSALAKGVKLRTQTKLDRLIQDDSGRVIGAHVLSMPSGWRRVLHKALTSLEYSQRYTLTGMPGLRKALMGVYRWLEKDAKRQRIQARRGVVLATGGFAFNEQMMQQHAPNYLGGGPLGRASEDGSGIQAGLAVGGTSAQMGRISTWRFVNPPLSFCKGLLVGRSGQRVCNEALYGAQVGEAMVEEHGGEAFLIVDKSILDAAKTELGPDRARWFQAWPMRMNFLLNMRRAGTPAALARKVGIDPHGLEQTIKAYNAMADNGAPDPLHKPAEYLQPLRGPLYAMDCSLASKIFICPMITLGGLAVDESSGQVIKADGDSIAGLYATGRSAVGLASNRYISGLSLADCVFSGRRAGRHLATGTLASDSNQAPLHPSKASDMKRLKQTTHQTSLLAISPGSIGAKA